jgi:peptidoglycan/xylan/chitin deacetylase (PgdA/CDA1 family)
VCSRCRPPSGLTRRSFHQGLFSAAILAPCLPGPADALVEPAISLVVPADAPRTVALTLDACSGLVDMRIVETLVALAVPATIFATGLWLRGNAPTIALMRARADLFTLQNHGELHLPPVLGTRRVYGLPVAGTLDAIHREVARGADLVAQARGERPRWYRGAAGLYSPPAIEAIQAMGCAIAGYSLNADGGASLPAASVARRIAAARSGDVIVAHVNQPHRPSGEGVAAGITALKQAGAVFVGLDTLPSTPPTCRMHAPPHSV